MKRKSIGFVESKQPIRQPVTKFGGQPVWLDTPQWPTSAETGQPMRFICQIALEPELFGELEAKMAYVFMTDGDEYVDGTWEPDAEGPTLYRMVKKMFKKKLVPEPYEFAVQTELSEDPEFVPQDERADWSDDQWGEYAEALDGNKIAGSPIFIQDDEFPGPGEWKLLMELDSTRVPFSINFGDGGIGYAFIAEDGKTGKFLWQCC